MEQRQKTGASLDSGDESSRYTSTVQAAFQEKSLNLQQNSCRLYELDNSLLLPSEKQNKGRAYNETEEK